MDNKRIKYFCHYACMDVYRQRKGSPAADTKIDYVVEVLNSLGYAVDIISYAPISIKGGYYRGYKERKGVNTIRYFACFGRSSNIFNKIYNRFLFHFAFFIWCLFNIKRKEQIIVYHSLNYDMLFIKLKKILGFTLIGDVEEIYQDVHPTTKTKAKHEYDFFDICDKYMFPNTILNEKLNPKCRPHLVIHGIYKINKNNVDEFNDGLIHILYAGTYDPVKGGAIASIEMSRFLSEKYHLHITGFGTDDQMDDLLRRIDKLQHNITCKLSFHGYLNDREFSELMSKCCIGLCTQDPTSKLNLTSFPSKILNYMSHGLVVLSGRNRAIEESKVGDLVFYYNVQEAKSMADSIMRIKQFSQQEIRDRLVKLDIELHSELQNFLKK